MKIASKKTTDKNPMTPPKWADVFLEWYCDRELLEAIQGDLHELFYQRIEAFGVKKARLHYVKDVISCLRTIPSKTSFYPTTHSSALSMAHNYLLVATRNLSKHLSLSAVHLFGLSIGMLAFIVMAHYWAYQQSYDTFHSKKELVYRVVTSSQSAEGTQSYATSYSGIGPASGQLASVKAYTRLFPRGEVTVNTNQGSGQSNSFRQKNLFFADSSLFEVFSFTLLSGDKKTVLQEPFTMVLSQTLASKYFPLQNPVGKVIQLDDQFGQAQYRITGIFKDLPANSHLQLEALTSYATLPRYVGELAQTDWTTRWFYTYLLLSDEKSKEEVENHLQTQLGNQKGEATAIRGQKETISLQPLLDIHLYSQLNGELGTTGNGKVVLSLLGISLLILAIAYINYINLATARALGRAKEVGIRKTIGASQKQLLTQFLLEAFLLQGMALLLACFSNYLLLPMIGTWLHEPLSLLITKNTCLVGGALLVVGTLAAGLYPALLLSAFNPVEVLKGKLNYSFKGLQLRKGLLAAQFVGAIVLLSCSFIAHKQMHFMLENNLGIDLEQILVVKGPAVHDSLMEQKLAAFRLELGTHPKIGSITACQYVPGMEMEAHQNSVRRMEKPGNDYTFYINSIDEDFLQTFGARLLYGRNFSSEFYRDEGKILINEKAAKLLGFSSPGEAINQQVYFPYGGQSMQGGAVTIIGVVADYHHLSLKENKPPILFRKRPGGYFSFKLNSSQMSATLETIKETYRKFYPKDGFEYYFLSDRFQQQYEQQDQFKWILTSSSALSMLIALLGLYGLASLLSLQRIKEVSIHKIHGADLYQVLYLLSKDLMKVVLISGVLSTVISYQLMHFWIQDFAYRIELNALLFLWPLLLVLATAILTIGYHCLKVARINPVAFLRGS